MIQKKNNINVKYSVPLYTYCKIDITMEEHTWKNNYTFYFLGKIKKNPKPQCNTVTTLL